MKLNDKVRFVNENLSGVITRLIDDKLVGVSVEDGFEIPVLKTELVLVNAQPDEPSLKVNRELKTKRKLEEGIYIILEQRFGLLYYCKLLNQFNYPVYITVYIKKGNEIRHQADGKLKPGDLLVLDNVEMDQSVNWPEFHIAVLPVPTQINSIPEPLKYIYMYRSKDLMSPENVEGKLVHSILLTPPRKEIRPVEIPLSKPIAKEEEVRVEMTRPQEVIDLHIEKLTTMHASMSPDEIMELQIRSFENNLEKAISLKYEKITFIHGVGNGTLKYMIRKKLSSSKEIKSFRDAMKEKFGFGATEVFIK